MEDAADLAGIFLFEDGNNFVVRIAIVDNEGQVQLPGEPDLPAECLSLRRPRRAVAVEVEAGFADGNNPVDRCCHLS